MSQTRKSSLDLKRMCTLAIFIAIELVMKLMGLGSVPVGPLNMSFLTVPVALGAILLGPVAGLIMGTVFGLCSLYDAISGLSVMTNIFFGTLPFQTVLLCVGTRALMGWLTGVIAKALRHADSRRLLGCYVPALAAPLLNTLFFMGFIVLVFWNTDYVQNLAAAKSVSNGFAFIVALVGVQGLVEALVCTLVGGSVAKGVSVALKM